MTNKHSSDLECTPLKSLRADTTDELQFSWFWGLSKQLLLLSSGLYEESSPLARPAKGITSDSIVTGLKQYHKATFSLLICYMQVFREDIEARFSSNVVLEGSFMTRNSLPIYQSTRQSNILSSRYRLLPVKDSLEISVHNDRTVGAPA